jgi:hypothetical protein
MIPNNARWLLSSLLILPFCGCGLLTHHLDDPNSLMGVNLDTPGFVKSVRCEIVTFLVENRLRNEIWTRGLGSFTNQSTNGPKSRNKEEFNRTLEYLKDHPYIQLDETKLASMQLDLKNTNMLSVTVSNDWRRIYNNSAVTRDYHAAPGLSETDTSEYNPPLAIPQYADLGPTRDYREPGQRPFPLAARYSTIYYRQPTTDLDFYCYKSLVNSPSVTLDDAANDIQMLLEDAEGADKFTNFRRIHVGGETLAEWFQDVTKQMSVNNHSMFPASSNIVAGSLAYNFMLDITPAANLGYSYTAYVISPFNPTLTASAEHLTGFTITLNTPDAASANAAPVGNTCIENVAKLIGINCASR